MKEKLFADFEPQSAEAWKAKLEADLKGKPYDELLWNSHGLTGKPFYTKEDLPDPLPKLDKAHPEPEVFGSRHWTNYQVIAVKTLTEANDKALHALNSGADGLLFEVQEQPDFEKLLKDIQPKYCHVSFSSDQLNTSALFETYTSYLKAQHIDLRSVKGFIKASGHCFQDKAPGLKTCLVNDLKTDSIPLQIAIQLAKIIDIMDGPDVNLTTAFNNLCLQVSLSTDYFSEIARHRAVNLLMGQLANAYGVTTESFNLISYSPDWSGEIDSSHSFMLHATTQAMSAIIGGTDGLVINPFYSVFEDNEALAERMARNISSVLREESYLNKNIDPSAGSYYIEHLSADISTKVLELLKEIENMGGLSKIELESFITTKSKVQ